MLTMFIIALVADPTPADNIHPAKPSVRILAAVPSPAGDPKANRNAAESVTLINDGETSVDLEGWRLFDKSEIAKFHAKDKTSPLMLTGLLATKEYRTYILRGRVQLNNGGDSIYLVDNTGNIIDEVWYEKKDVAVGKEIVFPIPGQKKQ